MLARLHCYYSRVQQACCFFLLLPTSVHFSHSSPISNSPYFSAPSSPLFSFFCQKEILNNILSSQAKQKLNLKKKLKINGFYQFPVFLIMPYICLQRQRELQKCESNLSAVEAPTPEAAALCCQSICSEIAILNSTSTSKKMNR